MRSIILHLCSAAVVKSIESKRLLGRPGVKNTNTNTNIYCIDVKETG